MIGQPYDAVKVVAFGKAMRNPVILALAFPVGAFVGAIAGVRILHLAAPPHRTP